MEYNELLDNVKGQLRKRITPRMQHPSTQAIREFLNVQERPELADREALANGTAFLLNNAIDRCITNVMVLGYNDSFDAAVDDLFQTRDAWGGFIGPRKHVIRSLAHELKLCADAFGPEIELFSRMHKLAQSGLSNDEVWSQISGA